MAALIAGLFGGASSSAEQAKSPSYSLQRLQQLHDRLSQFRESDLKRQGGGEAVVETVRQITEALVWGEHHDAGFFDFFCEKKVLSNFIRVLRLQKAPKTVKVQLLQTLSMLVQNIRRQTSLYYLLSNNHVNHLIAMPLDFQDEEILAYYITLLKSLAMRLDGETIKFFFIQSEKQEPNFPLYIEATKFFMHPDQMVRATVRTITLQVYQISFQPMRNYVLRHPTDSYFTQLAYHLRDLWLRIDKAASGASEDDLATLQHEIDLQQDLLIYLSDVFELGVAELNEVLADKLISCAMAPVLLSSVAATDAAVRLSPMTSVTRPALLSSGSTGSLSSRTSSPTPPRVLAPTIALFLIRQVFDTLRCRVLLEPLATALLQPTVSAALACVLPLAPGSGEGEEDSLPNTLRGRFLNFLECQEDTPFILAAAVVHSCVRNRKGVSLAFLESARVVPPKAGGDSRQPRGPESLEVFVLLLRALQRHSCWMADTFQVLVRVFLDIFLDPAVCHDSECYSAAVWAVHNALRSAAQRAWSFLQEALSGGAVDDAMLDVFMEEWELNQGPLPAVSEVCSNARRLLPPPPATASARGSSRGPGASAGGGAAQRSIRSFLLLRRLAADLVRHTPQVARDRVEGQPPECCWAGPTGEPSPLQVDPKLLGSFHEGYSFELGNTEKIVCSMSTPDGGRETRYLLLHDFWLLLVRPDLSSPGKAVVTTLWPLQQVQCLIDRSNPRLLMIAMQAVETAPAGGSAKSCVTTMLNFEAVRGCHRAEGHLQGRRWEVRAKLLREAVAFVKAACTQPMPDGVSYHGALLGSD